MFTCSLLKHKYFLASDCMIYCTHALYSVFFTYSVFVVLLPLTLFMLVAVLVMMIPVTNVQRVNVVLKYIHMETLSPLQTVFVVVFKTINYSFPVWNPSGYIFIQNSTLIFIFLLLFFICTYVKVHWENLMNFRIQENCNLKSQNTVALIPIFNTIICFSVDFTGEIRCFFHKWFESLTV